MQVNVCLSEENLLSICANKHYIWSSLGAVQWCF